MSDCISTFPVKQPTCRSLDLYNILDTPEEEPFDRLSRLAAMMLQVPMALISLLDENRQWFKSHVGLEIRETPIEYSFCAHAVQHRGIFVVPDATQDERFRTNPLVTGMPGVRFYAGAPLRMKDGATIGTLCVIDNVPRTMNEQECSMLAVLAEMAVREIELRRAVITDPLTGAFNRRMLTVMLKKEMGRYRRSRQPFCVAALDLDHFKRVNDTLGHEAGDDVLAAFTGLATGYFRSQDFVFRTGGEEFAVLLAETCEADAERAVERFRSELAARPLPTSAGQVQVTISAGVAQISSTDSTGEEILERADQALYRAKRGGRDRVVCVSKMDAVQG